jgi:hypothetical protein
MACNACDSMGSLMPGHRCQPARVSGDGESELRRANEASRRVDARHCAALDADSGDFALLDDVDAQRVGGARVAPRDRIVAHGPAARLQQAAVNRKARIGRAVEVRDPSRDLGGRQELRVDPVQPHRVAAAHCRVHVGRRVNEIQHAARAVHHVEIELRASPPTA